MAGTRVSIAVLMKLTAIVAVNLALIRFAPAIAFRMPPFLFLIVLLDLALVQAVALGRPLGTFYFAFLIAGVVSTAAITVYSVRESNPVPVSLHILDTAVQHYLALRGEPPLIRPYVQLPMLLAAEHWLTCTLCLVPACAAALLATRFRRRQRSGLPASSGTAS
jgi:hypothetical protein